MLKDAWSFDRRWEALVDGDWRKADDCFYDHPEIAAKHGIVTCLDGEPFGFVTWGPLRDEGIVDIGHNSVRSARKGKGYGKLQLLEAIRRIRGREGARNIVLTTNSSLVAPINYERAGFRPAGRRVNETECAFAGHFPDYGPVWDGR